MKKRKPERKRYTNALQVAISNAQVLSAEDQADYIALMRTAFEAFKRGDECAENWPRMVDLLSIATELCEMGLCSLPENKEAMRRALAALESVAHRFEHLGSWAFRTFEIEAVEEAVFLMRIQLQVASRRELTKAHHTVAERSRQALAGNAAPGTDIVRNPAQQRGKKS